MNPSERQAPPQPNDGEAVWDIVVADMRARDKIGRAEYGTPLQAHNGRDPAIDMYQESLDRIVYERQMLIERYAGVMPVRPGETWVEVETGNRCIFVEKKKDPASYVFALEDEPTKLTACSPHAIGARFRRDVPAIPHRPALEEEVRRLRARVAELESNNTAFIEARRKADRVAMVREFFYIAGQEQPLQPAIPREPVMRFRMALLVEEFLELLETVFVPDTTDADWVQLKEAFARMCRELPIAADLERVVRESVDLDFVVEGLRVALGVNSTPIWAAVARANWAKAGAPRRDDGKLLKPEGWEPADVPGLLLDQGWRP